MGFTHIKPSESTESQGIDRQETPVELRHWAPKGKKDGDGFSDVWMKPLAMERSTMFKFGKNGNLGWFMALFYPHCWG